MQEDSFKVFNEGSDCELIITVEHASNKIPQEYDNLGLEKEDLSRHIARDKGVKEIGEILAQKLNCFTIMGGYSRLLVDLNRRENEDELIVKVSDKTLVPANQNLSEEEKEKRLDKYYRPYYQKIEKQIEHLLSVGKRPILFSIHSYTPQLKDGDYRPWQAGVLWHKKAKLADFMYQKLQNTDKIVGENVPYDLKKYNTGTAVICGEENGFDYALIEIRDDEFENLNKGANEWAEILEKILREYLACV